MRKALLLLLPLVTIAAACRTAPDPYAPVENVRYNAIGAEPFWLLAIGDDRIVLRIAADGAADPRRDFAEAAFPRTLPRTVDGVRIWESGDGTAVITVEARPGPCRSAGRGLVYEDAVTVRLSGRELSGCGGRLLTGRRR